MKVLGFLFPESITFRKDIFPFRDAINVISEVLSILILKIWAGHG